MGEHSGHKQKGAAGFMSTDGLGDPAVVEEVPTAPAEGEPRTWKILVAGGDDDLHERAQRALSGCDFFGRRAQVLAARSGTEALELILRHPDTALLIADTWLEHPRAGFDAVEAIRGSLGQHRLRIVLCTEAGAAAPAQDFIVRHDVHDYAGRSELTDQKLLTLARSALGHFHQLAALERTRADLREVLSANEKVHAELVSAMTDAVSTRSNETRNHMCRVAEYARLLARLAGLDDETADLLYRAAPLHDTGKLAIPDAVLNKPGVHTDAEARVMRTHAELGQQMLSRHDTPVLQAAAIVAGEHHERWDGRGYPNGFRGEQIHIFGRITALADVFDALSHPRCYKEAWPLQRTLEYLREESGARFDPNLVDLFMGHLDQFVAIYSRLTDPPLMH
jgi:response regulator RpfG family c-di-GMP phosphodiesterase